MSQVLVCHDGEWLAGYQFAAIGSMTWGFPPLRVSGGWAVFSDYSIFSEYANLAAPMIAVRAFFRGGSRDMD